MQRANKRHTTAQIAALLEQAAVLTAQGRNQSEIAQALGISVMTFHRWRKAMSESQPRKTVGPELRASDAPLDLVDPKCQARIAELELENARLRKIVTDLLLDKMRLEDEAHQFGRPTALRA